MKRVLAILVLAASLALPSAAQVRFGAKAGVAINELHFDQKALSSDNTCGFTFGLLSEFNLPVLNLGVDASLMYVRRSATYVSHEEGVKDDVRNNRDYISIPVNLKWKFGLPVVGRFVSPFLTTGPDFSFLLSKTHFEEAVKNKTFDVAWNVGFGLEVMSKVQLAASYGFGLTKSAQGLEDQALFNGKNRFWTVTAAYMF